MKVLFVKIKRKVNEAMDATMSASNLVQGNGYGYVYRILRFNRSLEQQVNPITDDYYIYPGCMVTGRGFFDKDKKFTGLVMSIRKDSDGKVQVVYIKTVKTNRLVALSPDDLELILYSKPVEKEADRNMQSSKLFTPSHNLRI